MIKRITGTVAVLTATVVIAGCSAEAGKSDDHSKSDMRSTEMTARVGQTAPDFTLTSSQGEKYTLSDYEGRFVILEWINFDCPFVKKHYHSGNMPSLQQKYRDNDIVWLSICSSAPGKQGHFAGDELTSRIKSEGWDGTAYLIDADGKVGRMYDAKTTPHMYIINPEGELVYMGAIDDRPTTDLEDVDGARNYVVAALDAATAGKTVATSATKSYGCSVKY